MGQAARDQNRVTTLTGVSNADGVTPVAVYADPTTHRLLVDSASGSGTVTDVSVVTANGFAGSVANSTTTPAITLSTTVNSPVLKGDGTAISAASTTGSGSTVVLSNTPTLVTPVLGVATATSINKVAITAPATSATLTLADGSTLATSGAHSLTLTTTADSNVTFPTSGTLTTNTGSATIQNKTIDNTNTVTLKDTLFTLQDDGDTSKQLQFQLSGISVSTTRTVTLPDANGTMTLLGNASTGSGSVVLATSPTLVTPTIGVATATSVNKVAITAPATSATLTIADGKTLTANKSITLDGTDSTTMTFPSTSATIARTDAGQTFTGVNVFTSPKIITQISDTNGNVLINIGATGSAVNYVKVTNAVTGTAGPILSADGETNVDLKLAGKGTGKVHHTTGAYGDSTAYSPSAAATATLTFQTSNIHAIAMPAGNITIAFSNDVAGQCVMIEIKQDSSGSRTVTWPAGISWAGGSTPVLTTTANKVDTFGIRVVTAGSAYYGYTIGQNI